MRSHFLCNSHQWRSRWGTWWRLKWSPRPAVGDESDQLDASQAHQGCSSAPTHHPSCKKKRKTFREAAPLTYHLLAIFSMSRVWLGKLPGAGHGNPLQDSCLENPMDRGAWWATVHGVSKCQTRLKWLIMHTRNRMYIIKWKWAEVTHEVRSQDTVYFLEGGGRTRKVTRGLLDTGEVLFLDLDVTQMYSLCN